MDSCIALPLEKDVLKETLSKAQDWAAVHGLVLRTAKQQQSVYELELVPMTLLPSPFPRHEYEKVRRVQPMLSHVIHRVAHDDEFLRRTLKNTVAVDDFTAKLFEIHETVLEEGRSQPLSLGILRFDYLLDVSKGDSSAQPCAKQVEMNTIASSFAALATQMTQLHRYTVSELGHKELASSIPDNCPIEKIAMSMITAWKLYNSESAVIAFVIEPFVKMVGDHKLLDCEIVRQCPRIQVIRRTFKEFYDRGILKDDRALFIDGYEVAVTYLRTGYAPDDYPGKEHWDARLLLERSRSIKCPSIQYQLAGTKKVQQRLARRDVLERFVSDPRTVDDIMEVFTGLYSLDIGSEGNAAAEMVTKNPQKFVLKPQREGGGFNIYGDDIVATLKSLVTPEERSAYILMDRIVSPATPNYLLRPGKEPSLTSVVSELGIYGVIIGYGLHCSCLLLLLEELACSCEKVLMSDKEITSNEEVGHLLRTKSSGTNEGGVVSGSDNAR